MNAILLLLIVVAEMYSLYLNYIYININILTL